ncbi:MAG: TCP-1/cpn60 chaperonin family protein, partial [Candidatus Syntropharchaeia archaeon]
MAVQNPLIGKPEKEVHRIILMSNIEVAHLFSDLVKSSLGPMGSHKIIIDEDNFIIVTRDGRTIFDNIHVDHPIEGALLELAKAQDKEAGDGTTSAVVFASALLDEAAKLIKDGLHPTLVIRGYADAAKAAVKKLESIARPAKDREMLKNVIKSSLNSKLLSGYKEMFTDMILNAVSFVSNGEIDPKNIHLERVQGRGIGDTELFEGMIIESRTIIPHMPKKIENGKILLLDTDLAVEILGDKLQEIEWNLVNSDDLEKIQRSYDFLGTTIQKIHSVGTKVLLNHRNLDSYMLTRLAESGILALRNVKMEDLKKISRITGAKIVSDIKSISEEDVGFVECVEEKKVGDYNFVFIKGSRKGCVSFMIRGGSKQVVDETYRTLHDAIHTIVNVFNYNFIVPGGGATEVCLAQ